MSETRREVEKDFNDKSAEAKGATSPTESLGAHKIKGFGANMMECKVCHTMHYTKVVANLVNGTDEFYKMPSSDIDKMLGATQGVAYEH